MLIQTDSLDSAKLKSRGVSHLHDLVKALDGLKTDEDLLLKIKESVL